MLLLEWLFTAWAVAVAVAAYKEAAVVVVAAVAA